MFKNSSISTKVHIPLIMSIVIGFIIVGVTGLKTLSSMEESALQKEEKLFEVALKDQIKSKKNVWIK